ncbi:SulP family inorganic anion transporter [Streptomyces sp. AV19]|uniref:SulP family inorganic anion transporter n=1 Tax=Streptomyces sp. AV19 TaxID=2793068 RepID=UPI0018FEEFB7|nr:SulP family inorganic anion transporter [Streptomyces sp. AV19]MBH1938025.1 SulP family inorganic anion transporter [Streptomyces sp. AV19]MDG4536639.1 SulP family inorganic anion transporter [Streptomyces sp. AV19]
MSRRRPLQYSAGFVAVRRFRVLLPGRVEFAQLKRAPVTNLLAGATVAVAALPMALGFGVAAGLGARAGLVGAVVAGAVAALLGGSRWQITGPTGVMAVVLLPVAHAHGAPGVLTCGLLAGLVLLVMALLGASRFVHLVPAPVLTGFITGSSLVIVCQQIPLALGGGAPGEGGVLIGAGRALAGAGSGAVPPAATTLAVLTACLAGNRLRPGWPWPLLTVAAATAGARFLQLPLALIGPLPAGLSAPSAGYLRPEAVPDLLPSVFTVAALGALESLMTASAADTMTGTTHRYDGDRVLFGQAAANIAASLCGGMAATGTVCRTGINIRSGATTRLAALANSAVIALAVLAAGTLVSAVPLAALAGILLFTAWRMIDLAALRSLARTGHGPLAVTAVTAGVTVAVDLVTAVAVGVLLTAALALRTVTQAARVHHLPVRLPRQNPPTPNADTAVAVYRLEGPLLFTTAQRMLEPVARAETIVVIVDLSGVYACDATSLLALRQTMDAHHRRNARVLLSGIPQPLRHQLTAAVTHDTLHSFTTLTDAIHHARRHITAPDGGRRPVPASPAPLVNKGRNRPGSAEGSGR